MYKFVKFICLNKCESISISYYLINTTRCQCSYSMIFQRIITLTDISGTAANVVLIFLKVMLNITKSKKIFVTVIKRYQTFSSVITPETHSMAWQEYLFALVHKNGIVHDIVEIIL